MKTIQKRISLLLSFAIIASCLLTACGKTTNNISASLSEIDEDTVILELESAEVKIDFIVVKELERARAYGLMPEEWENDLQKAVTCREFCELISTLIQMTKPEKLDAWNEYAADALESDSKMQRYSSAIGLMYAAQALDCCYIHQCLSADLQLIQDHPDFWSFAGHTMKPWHDLPAGYQMLQCGPSDPIGTEFYHESWGDAAHTAIWFVLQRRSLTNEMPLLNYDDTYNMRWMDNLTREEAICAVLRLGESESNLLDDNRYISVYDHTSYDTSIITDELLNSFSNLPEPTHEKLPSTWMGMGISKTKDTVNHYYRDFQEAEIAFLAENGFNFTRIFFNFMSLRYPDFPEDMTLINEQELRELDQLIAWGIEYDVHIQLSISNAFNGSGSFDMDDAEWELFRAYWEALAIRYAGIPTRYLTFDLANELITSPENVSIGVNHMRDVVDSVRSADENRVLLISFNSNPWEEWVEGVASLGLSLAAHPYYPAYISGGDSYIYASADTPWPYPYFPQRLLPDETLTIAGDIGGKTLRLDFWSYEPFRVTFDNGETITVTVEGDYIHPDSCMPRFYEPYPVAIPDGVRKLTLKPIRNEVRFQEIGIEYGEISHWLVPHDEMAGLDTGGAELIWDDEEGWSSPRNCNAEFIYQDRLLPLMEIAQKHNVGFMVNEFGSYAGCAGWDVSVKVQYDSDMIAMLEANGISWCMCEMDYMSDPYEIFDEWENTTVATFTHTSVDGYRHTIQYSVELLEMYRQYTMKKTSGIA